MHCILAVVYTQVHFWLYICCDTQYYWLVCTSCKLEKICTGFALYFFGTTYSLQRQYTGYNQCCFILAMFNTDDILLVYILFLYWKFWLTSVRQYYIWSIIYICIYKWSLSGLVKMRSWFWAPAGICHPEQCYHWQYIEPSGCGSHKFIVSWI